MKSFFTFVGISVWLVALFVAGGLGLDRVKPLIVKPVAQQVEKNIGGRIWQGFQPVGTFTATSTSSTLPTPVETMTFSILGACMTFV